MTKIFKYALTLLAVVWLSSCSGGRETPDKQASEQRQPVAKGISPIGQVDSAMPLFIWPALESSSQYQLIIEDEFGNSYKQVVLPEDAGCSVQSSNCTATPAIGYYNKTLSWRVDAIVADELVALTDSEQFTTPSDTTIHPVTDLSLIHI